MKIFIKKKQQGGMIPEPVVVEKGEYAQDSSGQIVQVDPQAPSHDDRQLIMPTGQSRKVPQGRGGVMALDLDSVLSASQEQINRGDREDNPRDAVIKIKPKEANELAQEFGLKLNVTQSVSPSKFFEKLLDSRDKQSDKLIKALDKVDDSASRQTLNAAEVNQAQLTMLPSDEDLYQLAFQVQEGKKAVSKEYPEVDEFRQQGGWSIDGYKSNSPDRFNDFNLIPSNQITMEGVDQPLLLYGDGGEIIFAEPGQEYELPQSESVLEVPIAQQGRGLSYLDPEIREIMTDRNLKTFADQKGIKKAIQQLRKLKAKGYTFNRYLQSPNTASFLAERELGDFMGEAVNSAGRTVVRTGSNPYLSPMKDVVKNLIKKGGPGALRMTPWLGTAIDVATRIPDMVQVMTDPNSVILDTGEVLTKEEWETEQNRRKNRKQSTVPPLQTKPVDLDLYQRQDGPFGLRLSSPWGLPSEDFPASAQSVQEEIDFVPGGEIPNGRGSARPKATTRHYWAMNPAVVAQQQWLNNQGVTDKNGNPLKLDGRFGPLTQSALDKYNQLAQQREPLRSTVIQPLKPGIPAGGILDPNRVSPFQNPINPETVRPVNPEETGSPTESITVADMDNPYQLSLGQIMPELFSYVDATQKTANTLYQQDFIPLNYNDQSANRPIQELDEQFLNSLAALDQSGITGSVRNAQLTLLTTNLGRAKQDVIGQVQQANRQARLAIDNQNAQTRMQVQAQNNQYQQVFDQQNKLRDEAARQQQLTAIQSMIGKELQAEQDQRNYNFFKSTFAPKYYVDKDGNRQFDRTSVPIQFNPAIQLATAPEVGETTRRTRYDAEGKLKGQVITQKQRDELEQFYRFRKLMGLKQQGGKLKKYQLG